MAEKHVSLEWQSRGLVFRGEGAGKVPITIDGDNGEAPGPMETLLLAMAACTGSDVALVMTKKRLGLQSLRVEAHGRRRDEPPRRYTAIDLVYHVVAPGATETQVRHAIDLSLGKYCSVTHSLNPDIPVRYELDLRA